MPSLPLASHVVMLLSRSTTRAQESFHHESEVACVRFPLASEMLLVIDWTMPATGKASVHWLAFPRSCRDVRAGH
jgi:hypothetical protein